MSDLLHFPLNAAHLCQDCNAVSNCGRACPACASANVYPLVNIIDRKPVQSAWDDKERRMA